jgi:hypothetical protein
MCDYSLMHLPNRLAVEGEELIAHRFESGSIGLACPADLCPCENVEISTPQTFWQAMKQFFAPAESRPVTAVCIPPSTRLLLYDISEKLQRLYGLCSREEATFDQISAAANTYRDAVRFDNGQLVRLQELPEGQRLTVLDMSAAPSERVNAAEETLSTSLLGLV